MLLLVCVLYIFLVLGDHGVYMYVVYLKMEFRSCARGVSGVASFITTDEQLQLNRGCCFLVQAMLHEGFPFHQFNLYNFKSWNYDQDQCHTAQRTTIHLKKDYWVGSLDGYIRSVLVLIHHSNSIQRETVIAYICRWPSHFHNNSYNISRIYINSTASLSIISPVTKSANKHD